MGEPEILVTGGTGTLGRRVVDRLRAAGREVRVLSRSGRPGTVRGDLSTGENLEAAIRGIDTITTQFHDLVLMALHLLDRLPVVMPIPRGFRLQPMNVEEAAIRLVELSLAGPAGRVPDVGGPEVLTSTELARAYLEASGRSKRLVGVPLPGKAARAVRGGAQLCPDKRYGTVRWEEFLRENIQHQRISGPAGEGI
jgi:uncharacterized protein YbjT (DUF2867 family)